MRVNYTGLRAGLFASLVLTLPAIAQQPKPQGKAEAFDRTVIPTAGKTPELRVPAWTTTKLANGA